MTLGPPSQGLLACGLVLMLGSAWAESPGPANPTLRLSTALNAVPSADPGLPLRSAANQYVAQIFQAYAAQGPCPAVQPSTARPLSLTAAMERILCKSPALRQALASVQEQTANRDLADLAWRPRFSLYAERASNRIPASNSGSGSLNESVTGSLGVSWVIFDFGVRSANLEQARQSLASAIAGQDATLLTSLRDALKLYVDASAAWARLDAQRDAENLAQQSAEAARAKYAAQVASLSEKLQAETAWAQATLDRVRADGAWKSAASALAIAMGLPAAAPVRLPPPDISFPEFTDDVPDTTALEVLREQHPRLRGLQAELQALQARLESVRADGKGTVSLSGSIAGTRQLGQSAGGVDRSISTSLVAAIPLFNGTEQRIREAQVTGQTLAREAALTAARQEIDTALAVAIQQLEIERQGQIAAQALLGAAEKGHEVALGRYRAGVGSMVELLSAQAALANARSQSLQAVIARANAQIGLAVASGRLGVERLPVSPR